MKAIKCQSKMILYPDLKNNAQYLHPNASHSLISKLAFSRKIVSTNGQYHYPTLTKKKIERAKNWDDRFAMDFQTVIKDGFSKLLKMFQQLKYGRHRIVLAQ